MDGQKLYSKNVVELGNIMDIVKGFSNAIRMKFVLDKFRFFMSDAFGILY